jgi:hypothetical protein
LLSLWPDSLTCSIALRQIEHFLRDVVQTHLPGHRSESRDYHLPQETLDMVPGKPVRNLGREARKDKENLLLRIPHSTHTANRRLTSRESILARQILDRIRILARREPFIPHLRRLHDH